MEYLIPCILRDLSYNLSKMAVKVLESPTLSGLVTHSFAVREEGMHHELVTHSFAFVRKECVMTPIVSAGEANCEKVPKNRKVTYDYAITFK